MGAILARTAARLILPPPVTVSCYSYKGSLLSPSTCYASDRHRFYHFHFQMRKVRLSNSTKATKSTRWKGSIEIQACWPWSPCSQTLDYKLWDLHVLKDLYCWPPKYGARRSTILRKWNIRTSLENIRTSFSIHFQSKNKKLLCQYLVYWLSPVHESACLLGTQIQHGVFWGKKGVHSLSGSQWNLPLFFYINLLQHVAVYCT